MLEKTLESPLDFKEIQPVHPKYSVLGVRWMDWCWSWNSNILVTWCEELTHLKRPWCWERLRAGGEGDNRGWDGWMASPTQWTWAWVDSRTWWWTGRPGMLQSMGSQRVRHDWVTELNWIQWNIILMKYSIYTADQTVPFLAISSFRLSQHASILSWALIHFLEPQHISNSCIFPASTLESVSFPMIPPSFY